MKDLNIFLFKLLFFCILFFNYYNYCYSYSLITSTSTSTLTSTSYEINNLKSEEIAVLLYDSRPLRDYWLTSALWNYYYTQLHHHQFIYYNLEESCNYKNTKLAEAWCKVRAMLQAEEENPNIKVFLYLDSDAVISKQFVNTSVIDWLKFMQNKLQWNVSEKPIIFNQDGPCWWCKLIQKVGYTMCLNAGTVLWYRNDYSRKVLLDWWDSTMDEYSTNPLKRKFRTSWPWEQDRQMAIYHRQPEHIQIASHPDSSMIIRDESNSNAENWCFSHLPGYNCFIAHHCANPASKQRLRKLYQLERWNENSYISTGTLPFSIVRLTFN